MNFVRERIEKLIKELTTKYKVPCVPYTIVSSEKKPYLFNFSLSEDAVKIDAYYILESTRFTRLDQKVFKTTVIPYSDPEFEQTFCDFMRDVTRKIKRKSQKLVKKSRKKRKSSPNWNTWDFCR